ncbi:hypothetical protein BCV70DRAFT_109797 [Testicularia cyperi]|uniref:Uncharacterized protein n=1 Tax=Testicularia cyperi TaxID=1882483 RepID=A0A317XNX2_9BASI|nr:hypothetical protein BCV70DRAFT_109797 [Testicularia cyperi]
MPVPVIPASASASETLGHSAPNHENFSMSQSGSIAASASDLKRPSSAASSVEDSQTLSRTKNAKTHYGRAARAFLQKDHRTALVQSQRAVDVLASSSHLGESLTSSAILSDRGLDVAKLVEKVAILRLTALTHVYTDDRLKQNMLEQLSQTHEEGADKVVLLLSKQPQSLISHLWFQCLRLCSQTSAESDAPSLDPTPETIHLAVELPASVVSSAVLAALRLDQLDPSIRIGTQSARLISEWYLASFSSVFASHRPTEKARAAYEKIVGLYSLHVLATRLNDWEYAREFVGYSSLPESDKFSLLEQISEAQAHVIAKPEREQEAIAAAQRAYEEEKVKRAAEDKQSKASGSINSSNGRPRDLGRGDSHISGAALGRSQGGSLSAGASRRKNDETLSASSSGSDSGSPGQTPAAGMESDTASGGRRRSQSPAYFAPRSGGAISSNSTSPALSPGSSRGTTSLRDDVTDASSPPSSGPDDPSRSERRRRSPRRTSRSSHSDHDGNESSTSAASSRSRTRDRVIDGSISSKDDASYAATRTRLSQYLNKDHGPSASRSAARGSERGEAEAAVGARSASLLSSLRSWFDLRNHRSRNYLMSAIVMMLVFYRVTKRSPTSASRRKPSQPSNTAAATTSFGQRSAAAQSARNKLIARNQGSEGLLGLGWILLVWRKVMDTVKMGTQVSYL